MSRSYIRCPCEKCIVLAICKGKGEYIKCSILYKYIRAGIKQYGLPHPKKKYRIKKLENIFGRKVCIRAGIKQYGLPHPKKKYRIKKLENIFGRKVCIYEITNLYKNNPDLILWWKPCIWWE